MIKTTINIKVEVYDKLKAVADQKNVEIEEIIIVLMRYFSKKFRKQLKTWKAIQYQERKPIECWRKVHVRWYGDEYEFLIDLRKIHKKSVSRLITEAVNLFLDDIWSFFDIIKDNYFLTPYFILKFDIQNTLGCIILWGIPIKSLLHKYQSF